MNISSQGINGHFFKKHQETWSDFLESLSAENNFICKVARRFKSSYQPFPLHPYSNTQAYAYTNEEKANTIALNLE